MSSVLIDISEEDQQKPTSDHIFAENDDNDIVCLDSDSESQSAFSDSKRDSVDFSESIKKKIRTIPAGNIVSNAELEAKLKSPLFMNVSSSTYIEKQNTASENQPFIFPVEPLLFTEELCKEYSSKNKHFRPPTLLSELVLLVLNCEAPLSPIQVWNYISGLFPYFETHFSPQSGRAKISIAVARAGDMFLREFHKRKVKVLLNPSSMAKIKVLLDSLRLRKHKFKVAMYKKEYVDLLFDGALKLSQITLFTLWSRGNSNVKINKKNLSQLPKKNCIKKNKSLESPSIQTNPQAQCISPHENEETFDDTSFSPKIVDICSLRGTQLENELPPFINEPQDSINGACDKDIADNVILSMPKDNVLKDYSNTVWSTNITSETSILGDDATLNPSKDTTSSFPEVENCLPRWKQIFNWIQWRAQERTVYCSVCNLIRIETFSKCQPVVVIQSPKSIFKVSGLLRNHSEKSSHKMAEILMQKKMIKTLIFLVRYHFTEFSSLESIRLAIQNLTCEKDSANVDQLKSSIIMLGQCLESKIIEYLKDVPLFSVISDPCQGILIVRWLNENDEPEEHVIGSYLSIIDMNPMEYLNSLGVDTARISHYINSKLCDQCSRCKASSNMKSESYYPLRFPLLERFMSFLWGCKVLKPYFGMASTLRVLWKKYPYKFAPLSDVIEYSEFDLFFFKPLVLKTIFDSFMKFKKVANEIYLLDGCVEALGFMHFDLHNHSHIIDLFPVIEETTNLMFKSKMNDRPDHSVYKRTINNIRSEFYKIKSSSAFQEHSTQFEQKNLDDLRNILEISISEVQKPIYKDDRSSLETLHRMTTLSNLDKYPKREDLEASLYRSLGPRYKYEQKVLFYEFENFLAKHPVFERKDSLTCLKLFKSNSALKSSHPSVYEFYKLIALLPIHLPTISRTLYEVSIFCSQFHQLPWAYLGPNIMENILMMISELPNKSSIITQDDLCKFWNREIAKSPPEQVTLPIV